MREIDEILEENRRRNEVEMAEFDPISGKNSTGKRFEIVLNGVGTVWLPETMRGMPVVKAAEMESAKNNTIFERERIKHDFPYWAAKYVRIKHKGGGEDRPFVLNRPQRKLVEALEKARVADEPIRIILLKARQWGGSTCVQIYMAWMQLVQSTGLNSLIIAHQTVGSDEIKDMFDRMIASYPAQLLHEPGEKFDENEKKMVCVGRAGGMFRVISRNCKIKIGTAERPDACRGGDYNLVHLSEVGIWKQTRMRSPEDIVRSATAGVLLKPNTMIVLESTANGNGNFFHNEYVAACRGESQFKPLFVAWYEIELYREPLENPDKFARKLYEERNDASYTDRRESGEYLWNLWQSGVTLEAINWYVKERCKYSDHARMASEYPTTDVEAFAHSGFRVFSLEQIEALREDVKFPDFIGEISPESLDGMLSVKNVTFIENSSGLLKVWSKPSQKNWVNRYLAVVDIGGRSDKSDWNVIAVIDRVGSCGRPEIAAQWRGHCDFDRLAELAAKIAAYYNNALLVIESNTAETRYSDNYTDPDQTPYLFRRLRSRYENIYMRMTETGGFKYGFHMNVRTKAEVIAELIRQVRERLYVERDKECLAEYARYELRPDGVYAAIKGQHDDILMTRAIGLFISQEDMETPRCITCRPEGLGRKRQRRYPRNEATFI